MKLLAATGAMVAAMAVTTGAIGGTLELSSEATNQINVTSDSQPGWIPTTEQRQRAIKAVEVFLDALEGGRYAAAYGMQAEILKRDQTLTKFVQDAQKFRAQAGPIKFWKLLKITWTKDSARAPSPGIYAAVDLTAQFANVDRDCGYIVLYQQSVGDDFAIVRRENNYMDNATARKIEEKHSMEEVMRVWAQLSRYCPNYASSFEAP